MELTMSVDRNKVEMQRRPTTSENGPEADLVLTIVTEPREVERPPNDVRECRVAATQSDIPLVTAALPTPLAPILLTKLLRRELVPEGAARRAPHDSLGAFEVDLAFADRRDVEIGLAYQQRTEYAPFVSVAATRIKQRSPGLVCNHSALSTRLIGLASDIIVGVFTVTCLTVTCLLQMIVCRGGDEKAMDAHRLAAAKPLWKAG